MAQAATHQDHSFGDKCSIKRFLVSCEFIVQKPQFQGVNVTVALLPLYLEGISETEGVATLFFDADLKWTDPRLRWNQSLPGRKDCIFVEKRRLWIPYLRCRFSN